MGHGDGLLCKIPKIMSQQAKALWGPRKRNAPEGRREHLQVPAATNGEEQARGGISCLFSHPHQLLTTIYFRD